MKPPLPYVLLVVTTSEILIYGSAELVNTLLAHDLIDRYRLMVFPVLLGAGKRFFNGHSGLKAFRLAEATTTSTGVAMLTYELER